MLSGRARHLATSALVAVSAAGLLSITPDALADRRPVPRGRSSAPLRGSAALATRLSPQAARFRAQELTWRGCIDRTAEPGLSAGYYRLQCATLSVPLDWSAPEAGTIEVAVSRLPASADSVAPALFTNPGGPGAAGIDLPLLFVSDGRKQLTRSQDIYGMDVRGTGDSANVTCGGPGSTLLDPRDRSTANLDLILDAAQLHARSCDLAGGALIDHVTTDQTVRDIDLLRSVVGAPKLNWIGFSAGTWLGAQYATAYPQNVGHMVLDSNVDFTATWQQALARQPAGFQRRFTQDFLPWAAKYHSTYHLGSSSAAVQASYERIRTGLQPTVPIDSAVTLDDLLAGSLYSKGLFPVAASVLADLNTFLIAQRARNTRLMGLTRNRVTAALPQLRRSTSAQPFASDAPDAAFLAVTCNDTPWTGNRDELLAESALAGADSPLIGWASVDEPCVFWHRPDITTPVPTGAGVPPVLMVQSENDPATPIEGARAAAAGFAGARLLVVTKEGDHGLYAGGNACVDQAVESFVLAGTLPAEGATCPGRPLPKPTQSTLSTGGYAMRSVQGASPVPPPGTNPLVALRELTTLTH